MDVISSRIGVKDGDLSAWYKVSREQYRQLGLIPLLDRFYNNSLYKLLMAVYPEHNWLPWKFVKLPKNAFSDPEIIEKALAHVESELNLTSPRDWRRVKLEHLKSLGIEELVRYRPLSDILKKYRPTSAASEG